jgi:hypothetical protein
LVLRLILLHGVAGLGKSGERHGQETHDHQPREHFLHDFSPVFFWKCDERTLA